jgi:transposase InsO family protein
MRRLCRPSAKARHDHEHEPAVEPYDNASCERFLKTLKREEIYANEYRDLDHLNANIAAFIDNYYNRVRLHSALGYKPPDEFEQTAALP